MIRCVQNLAILHVEPAAGDPKLAAKRAPERPGLIVGDVGDKQALRIPRAGAGVLLELEHPEPVVDGGGE